MTWNFFKPRKPRSIAPYRNVFESTIGAARGFADAIRHEKKIRQVFVSAVLVTLVCWKADVGYFQILMVIFSWIVAFICETFNTAIEKALDYSGGKTFHPLIHEGKHYASACTFVSTVFAFLLASFVLWGRWFAPVTV